MGLTRRGCALVGLLDSLDEPEVVVVEGETAYASGTRLVVAESGSSLIEASVQECRGRDGSPDHAMKA